MSNLTSSLVVLIVWAIGRLRTPFAIFVAVYTAFGGRIFDASWALPSPWRAFAGLLAGWAAYEFASLLRFAFDSAWKAHKESRDPIPD